MEHQTKEQKMRIYITVEPYNVRFGAAFYPSQSIGAIRNFIKNIMNKLHFKFNPGRVEHKDKLAILLPEFKVSEVLEENSEVIVYSQDYGLTLKTLPGDGNDQRLPYFQRISSLYQGNLLNKKQKRNNKTNDKKNGVQNTNESVKKPNENQKNKNKQKKKEQKQKNHE